MRDGYGLEYPVLYDTDTSVTREWGVYNLLGDGVATPATFIIQTDGTIESGLVGQTISDRPTTESVLDTLAELAGVDRAATPGNVADDHADGGGANACVASDEDLEMFAMGEIDVDPSAGDCGGPEPASSLDAVDAVDETGPPVVGGLVPDFVLPTAQGQTVSLGDQVGEGNVVFAFFRAWW